MYTFYVNAFENHNITVEYSHSQDVNPDNRYTVQQYTPAIRNFQDAFKEIATLADSWGLDEYSIKAFDHR